MNASVTTTKYSALLESATSSPGVRLVEAAAFSILAGLSAQFAIHLPFTPVPITGQTLVILYAGALLGSRWGVVSALMYLAEGCWGLPFFAPGATDGVARLCGPTGGYLIGFVAAAWAVGKLAEKGWDRSPVPAGAMMALGSAVVFAFGLVGLSRFVPINRIFALGLYPFILGDVFKISLGAAMLPAGRKLLG